MFVNEDSNLFFETRICKKKKTSMQRFKCMSYNRIDFFDVNTKSVSLLIFARIMNFASKACCAWLDPSLVRERWLGDNNLKTQICIVNKGKLFRMDFPITYQATGLYLFSETVLKVKLIFSFLLQGIRYWRFFSSFSEWRKRIYITNVPNSPWLYRFSNGIQFHTQWVADN